MKKDVGIPNLNGVNHVVAYGRKSIAIVEIIACSIFLSLFIYQGRLFSPDTKISVGYILISGLGTDVKCILL